MKTTLQRRYDSLMELISDEIDTIKLKARAESHNKTPIPVEETLSVKELTALNWAGQFLPAIFEGVSTPDNTDREQFIKLLEFIEKILKL